MYQPLNMMMLLDGASKDEFEQLSSHWTLLRASQGTILHKPFQKGQYLYLIQHGSVVLVRQHNGDRQVVRTLGAGAIFGQMRIMGQSLADYFAEASVDSELFLLSRAAVEKLIRQRPQVALRVLSVMGPSLIQQELTTH